MTGLTPDNLYTFNLNGLSGNTSISLYQGPYTKQGCYDYGDTTSEATRSIVPQTGSIWIRLYGHDSSAYTLTYSAVSGWTPYESQGTIDAPTELLLGSDSSQVGSGSSYYVMKNLKAGHRYSLAFDTNEDSLVYYIYTDGGYEAPVCERTVPFVGDAVCNVTVPDSEQLWIRVDGSSAYQYLGAYFLIESRRIYESQGSDTEPAAVNLSGQNRIKGTGGPGTRFSYGHGYYRLTGLMPGKYLFDVRKVMNGSGSMTASDGGTSICTAVFGATCLGTVTSGTIDFAATPPYDSLGAMFTVALRPVPSFDGTQGDPAKLLYDPALSDTAWIDTSVGIKGGSDSYYHITGLTAGTLYRVVIRDATDAVPLYVYGDAGYSVAECSDNYMTDAHGCRATADVNENLWVVAGAGSTYGNGAWFKLGVIPLPSARERRRPSNSRRRALRRPGELEQRLPQSSLTAGRRYLLTVSDIDDVVVRPTAYDDAAHATVLCIAGSGDPNELVGTRSCIATKLDRPLRPGGC